MGDSVAGPLTMDADTARPSSAERASRAQPGRAPRAGGGAADTASPVEAIAQAYLAATHGDAAIALRCAITDALSDLLGAERRARDNSRLISRGYAGGARGGP